MNAMLSKRWDEIKEKLHDALELEPQQRSLYLQEIAAADAELGLELESLVAAHDKANTDFLNTPLQALSNQQPPNQDDLMIGRQLGNYEVVEQIGAGGMGEVYRAIRADDQYHMQVAIKLMRAGQDSGFVINRFKNERQILASLDHSNIARVLDGGTTKEGMPYFVMELIDGQPIDEYCDSHKLLIAERLKLFLQVCSAVIYAHQHLIIHRDVKPSNILVTSNGVPKLLDFGIAKILDVQAASGQFAPTQTMFRVLTPGYASPEQVRSEPITTASDVYSLGVVLYVLLTGHHPHPVVGRTPQDIAHAVCEVEPEKPSTIIRRTEPAGPGVNAITPASISTVRDGSPEKLAKRLSGDLDNIVLMALRKEPYRRYTSVERFAEDIHRHLDDLPVFARKDNLRYRISKFATRHKTGVFAAGLVTLTLLAALAVTVREARVAQRRFNDVRSLANSLIFDIHDSIQDLPGATPARKLIVERALQYLDRLAQESKGDASLQRELAAAYKKIGDVQGYPYSANLGDTPGARKSYEKALAIRQSLFMSNPENIEDAVGVAESSRLVSDILLVNSDTKGALENVQRAVKVSEQTDRAHPDGVKVLEELMRDYEAEADILGGNFNLSNLGDSSAALTFRRKQLEVSQRIVALKPNDSSARRSLAVGVTRMGDQLWLDGQTRGALPYYLQAQKVFEDLANSSQGTRTLEDLDETYNRLQQLETARGEFGQAVDTNRRALEVSKKLSLADPHSSKAQLDLATDYANFADSTSRVGQKEEAVSAVNRAMKIMSDLVKLNPKDTEFRGVQAAVYVTAGDVFRRFKDLSPSLRYYREALSLTSQVQSEDPNNVDGRLRLAAISNWVGELLTQLRELKSAREMYSKALELAIPEATSSHPNEQARYSTADSYTGLGEIEAALAGTPGLSRDKRIELWTQATASDERSLQIWAQIKEPGNLSPDGFDCVPSAVVAQRLAKYKAALVSAQAQRKQ
jgi:serine/threonine protein kinase